VILFEIKKFGILEEPEVADPTQPEQQKNDLTRVKNF